MPKEICLVWLSVESFVFRGPRFIVQSVENTEFLITFRAMRFAEGGIVLMNLADIFDTESEHMLN